MLHPGGKNIKILKIENPSIHRQIGLIYHKEKYMGFAVREFMSLLERTIKDNPIDLY